MVEQSPRVDTDVAALKIEAASVDTPRPRLTELSRHKAPEIRATAAANPMILTNVLARLSKDEDKRVRAAVAANEVTRAEVLEELAFDEDWTVRAATAGNRTADAFVMGELVRDDDVRVKIAASGSGGLSKKDLDRVAADDDARLREAAAANPGEDSTDRMPRWRRPCPALVDGQTAPSCAPSLIHARHTRDAGHRGRASSIGSGA